MDIYCPKCGEPWDLDELHAVVAGDYAGRKLASFDAARKAFYRDGCKVFGATCGPTRAHPAIAATYDLLGDDIDGAAAMLDDAEYLGLLDRDDDDGCIAPLILAALSLLTGFAVLAGPHLR